MKEIIKTYLDRYFDTYHIMQGVYPMVPYEEDEVSKLYFGKADEDEYIQWKYQDNITTPDFTTLEEKYGVRLPDELREYYSSYLFLKLQGFYNGMHIWLHPITDIRYNYF